jgi:glycosyltransferase involved in cell wall biosynthesis
LPALNRARVLISTVDACGLPLALLKRVGALRSRLIYVSQGLSDRIEAYGREKWLPRWYRRLLLGVEELVTLSSGAGSALAAWLGVPDDRVRVLPFGTDHEFWANSAVGAVGAYVLSVGSDAGRDYATLLAASGDEPIHVVTRQPLSLDGRRNVVHTSRHSPRELRDLYSHARFVVIPLREGSQPSGQSAALQAMACGKAVVLTKTSGWWGETFLRDGDNCLVVPPGDPAALRAAIARLAAAPGDCARLGARARETVVAHFSETRMVKRLDELIVAQFQA